MTRVFVTIIYFLVKKLMCFFLTTFSQLIKNNFKKKTYTKVPRLKKNPQVKGIITFVTTMKPKKPNSAIRHIAKTKLTNNYKITARIPGIGYLCSKYNRVLAHGGRANDLPGISYTLIRGVYDFSPVIFKKKRRSIYGTSRPDNYTKHIRRCFRSNYSN